MGSVIAFRLGEEDAPRLVKQFAPFPETTLLELARFEVLVKMLRAGQTVEPFLAATLPPIPVYYGEREAVLARSRRRYAMPRHEVERKLSAWWGGGRE